VGIEAYFRQSNLNITELQKKTHDVDGDHLLNLFLLPPSRPGKIDRSETEESNYQATLQWPGEDPEEEVVY
jgi:hypothetical protein